MENKYLQPERAVDINEGMLWRRYEAIPTLAKPAEILDAVEISVLDYDERLIFTCLQGLINRRKPRFFLVSENAGEGNLTWPELLGLKLKIWERGSFAELLAKYADDYSGAVLWSPEKSDHYANLATTAAGIHRLLPVTAELLASLEKLGCAPAVKLDLSELEFDNAIDIYNYMYENYWPLCTKKLIVSAAPRMPHYVRDLAVCCGAVVIWTENREPSEKAVYCRYLADMKAGESIATGWYTEERSGIGAAAEFGLSTIPSDFFENSTVYAGMKHFIEIPETPKMPPLESRIYLAIYLSDGDNVQYNQHAMLNLWRNPDRGSCPINWTVSPGLADFAPAMLNYYYETASEGDCFVSGPSGIGYSLLYDRHNKRLNLRDRDKCDAYARFTERYLSRTGIRSITVWDEMNDMHRASYAENIRSLYGATEVDWRMKGEPLTIELCGGKAFIPNEPGYTPSIDEIFKSFKKQIEKWDGGSPLFLSAQGVSWNMTPANIKTLAERLGELAPDRITILRADHFFNLFAKANGLPYNLCLAADTAVSADINGESASNAATGSPCGSLWSAPQNNGAELTFRFGENVLLTRCLVRHAGAAGLSPELNTADFDVLYSADGVQFAELAHISGNIDDATDIDLPPVRARWLRLRFPRAAGKTVRVADVEIYGVKS